MRKVELLTDVRMRKSIVALLKEAARADAGSAVQPR